MNASDFNNIASGIQALVLAAAAIIGGLWAGFRFLSLKEVDQARVAAEKGKAEVEAAKRALRETAILDWTITCEPLTDPDSGKRYLVVKLGVKNTGNTPELLDWSSAAVNVVRIVGCKDGLPATADEWTLCRPSSGPGELLQSVVGPSASAEYLFLAPLEAPGLYRAWMLMMASPRESSEGLEQLKKIGVLEGPITWEAETYCVIPRDESAGDEPEED